MLLTGKNSKDIEDLVKSFGFEITALNPDAVISYGGDGTLLSSERTYPGIPKLPIRNSLVCKKCPDHKEEVLLKNLAEGRLKIKQYSKLETTIFYQKLLALNDFVIRNATPIHTIRFKTNQEEKLLIGDGIVLSTPFGSTGYFKSITGKTFKSGFGIAFNNTTEKTAPSFFKDNDKVTFKLIRGTATLSFDNNPDLLKVDEGSQITFKLSEEKAKIFELESLRCPKCIVTRG